MATAFNGVITLYKKVPLVKGGTTVLYRSGASAKTALGGYAYEETGCSFSREGRSLRVDEPISNLYGCNYVCFTNPSHGDKLFFAFVDEINYINDNCTEIVYTIDTFPTGLEETDDEGRVMTIRNTVKRNEDQVLVNNRYVFNQNDYMPPTADRDLAVVASKSLSINSIYLYFTVGNLSGTFNTITYNGHDTGIFVKKNPTAEDIAQIAGNNDLLGRHGNIIGGYASYDGIENYNEDVVVDVLSNYSATANKLKTGAYISLSVMTSFGVKSYDIEKFNDPYNIVFTITGELLPQPHLVIYPRHYCGVDRNVSAGMEFNFPSIPIYNPATFAGQDITGTLMQTGQGGVTGLIYGGIPGLIAGAASGALSGIAAGLQNVGNKPTVYGGSSSTFCPEAAATVSFVATRPLSSDIEKIEEYFIKYGYAINAIRTPNLDNEAFLQIGDDYYYGSKYADEMNMMAKRGIRIWKP